MLQESQQHQFLAHFDEKPKHRVSIAGSTDCNSSVAPDSQVSSPIRVSDSIRLLNEEEVIEICPFAVSEPIGPQQVHLKSTMTSQEYSFDVFEEEFISDPLELATHRIHIKVSLPTCSILSNHFPD